MPTITSAIVAQALIAVTGLTAAWLSNSPRFKARRWACVISLIGQPAWLYTAWQSQQWGVILVTIGYTVAFIRGVHTYWIHPP
jgi:hypothetical protein